jgi:hypothetical protein
MKHNTNLSHQDYIKVANMADHLGNRILANYLTGKAMKAPTDAEIEEQAPAAPGEEAAEEAPDFDCPW